MPKTILISILLALSLSANARSQADVPIEPPPSGGLSAMEVSFMDWAAIDADAVIARIPSTSVQDLSSLRRFAAFEAMHNSSGAADKAGRVVAAIDASGLLANVGAPAAPSSTRTARRGKHGRPHPR